ncbi:ABC transporter ATP-binding protein [Lachnotalea glycerini]|uniref:ABC transporter ATP-binding protein n=1 Tax=Lachnotalea glycerini TaxID=1763509 RepID=A0A371JKG8_9FIRM|nr:ABC transporter ATP-binding protein [Lachnotalea glycerini]RDY33234.1 ABC transporter ATP-binding protein [Lachnotalea glycerini]
MVNKDVKVIIKYYLKFIKQYNCIFVALLVLSSISSIILLINPILNGKILDYALNMQFQDVLRIVIYLLMLFVMNSIISVIYTYINNYLQNKVTYDIKKETFKKIIYLKMEDLNENSIGKYMSFLEGDTNTISSFYINTINSFFTYTIKIFCSGFFIFRISIKLSLIGLISLPIMLIINYYFGKTIKKLQEKNRKIFDKYTSNVQETFSGLKEIKGLCLENWVEQKNNLNLDNIFKVNMRRSTLSSFGGLAQNLTGFLMQIAVYLVGCYMIGTKKITVGYFSAFINYLNQFLSSAQQITSINISLQSTLVSIDRYEKLITNCQTELIVNNENETIINGDITVENITFSYKNKKVINDINLTIRANEMVAIVGANGSGKTTFLSLLMGFYKFEYGKIYFDEIDISKIDFSTIRKNITYIQQHPFLFNDTIKNNLLVGKEDATDEEIKKVCESVYFYDTIMNLPDGFNTVIGECGLKLSGGQRQQLAIARGILRNSKIFLFDEITSNIDGITEKHILNTIRNLSKQHTVIIIAHRNTMIVEMPRIIVFDNGKNIAEGTHFELLNNCLQYQNLFKEINKEEKMT